MFLRCKLTINYLVEILKYRFFYFNKYFIGKIKKKRGITERALKFLEFLNWARNGKNNNKIDVLKKLIKIFDENNLSVKKEQIPFFKELVTVILKKNLENEDEISITKLLDNYIKDYKDVRNILFIYQVLILLGFYQSALVVRQIARARAIQNSKHEISLISYDAFAAAIEIRDFDLAESKILKPSIKFLEKSKNTPFSQKITLNLLRGYKDNSIGNFDSDNYLDIHYKKIIHNRSVAIVGSAPDSDEYRDEINNFDVIIKTNYLLDQNSKRIDFTGNQKLVSYFTDKFLDDLFYHSNESQLDELYFCIFRKKKYVNKTKNLKVKTRIISRFPWRFNGVANAIPDLVYDTFLYSPSRIKIFNTTMYINTKEGLYRDGYFQENHTITDSFSWHDPLTQFSLLKNLLLSGRLEVEDRLWKILQRTEGQYLLELQKQFFSFE